MIFGTLIAIVWFASSSFFLYVVLRFGDYYGKTKNPAKYWCLVVLYAAMIAGSLWLLKIKLDEYLILEKWPKPPN
jgi:hypothetical protein